MQQSGLDKSAESDVGKILVVTPSYGWGWGWVNPDGSPFPVKAFELRLDSLFEFEGVRRGGVGVIVTSEHPLKGMWVVFSTRHVLLYDFRARLGQYNLEIGHGLPTPSAMGWPMFAGGPTHQGFGEVRVGV